jgi:trans-aconitate 2-methyltransferase
LKRREPDWDAATYDRISDPHVRWASDVIERLDPRGVDTILDAGCGTGRVTEMVLRRFPDARVIAVDSSEPMLAEARRRLQSFGGRVEFVRADLETTLPIDDAIDAVFSTAVFHWVLDHGALFGNLADVLEPGGQLVSQWGGGENVARVQRVLDEIGGEWQSPWNFATEEQTAARLRDAGFVDIDVWLNDDPADFGSREAFEEYLRTICLPYHVDQVPENERDSFIAAVADRLPDHRIDYVRINAVARRG